MNNRGPYLVIAVLVLCLLALLIYMNYEKRVLAKGDGKIHADWSMDLAKDVDPEFAGKSSGFIVFQMSCGTPVPNAQGVPYLYSEFNINLRDGRLIPLRVDMPPSGFKCPPGGTFQQSPAPHPAQQAPPAPAPVPPQQGKKP